ncbi:hypothetical protein LC612_21225 [Nostoc sp. CHAB 5834]|nr:hypothetical protein [Nostoc sp. CHAB 5834]
MKPGGAGNSFKVALTASFIVREAIHRWQNPEPILGLPMLLVAVWEQCDFVRRLKKSAMPTAGYAYAKNYI